MRQMIMNDLIMNRINYFVNNAIYIKFMNF